MILSAFNELGYYRIGYIIKLFVKWSLTIVPIIILIKCMIDIFKVVMNPDEAKNSPKTIARRFITGLIIFLLPIITDYIFKTLTDYNDEIIVKYYENASISKIREYEKLAEKEKEAALDQKVKDLEETAKKQAEEKKKKMEEIKNSGNELKVPTRQTDTGTGSSSGQGSTGTGYSGGQVGTPSTYDITADPKFNNYQVKASCNSSSLHYKVIVVNGEYYSLIWAENPYEQLNNALAASNSYGRLTGDKILNNEINSSGYQSKCMVGVNSSFFSYSTNSTVTGMVIHKGEIVKNTGSNGAVCGIANDGILKQFVNQPASEIAAAGVRNTFGISNKLTASSESGGATAGRTQIFQYDNNNFVLFTGSGTVGGCAQKVYKLTGAETGFNLDGGGSRKLYYKTQDSSTAKSIMEGGRPVTDMLYFVEK